ncbi:MarR family winged helix-turn-helix transcriptional regulator, partial [Chloroflexota bacterium]
MNKTSTEMDFALWQLLWIAYHVIEKARSKELAEAGISLRSAGILSRCLELGKNATPAALHRGIFVERHTITVQLNRMERNGLIKKVKDLD